MADRFSSSEASNSPRQREASSGTVEEFRKQAERMREGQRIRRAVEQERLSNTPSPPHQESERRPNEKESTHETSGPLTQFLNELSIPPEILAEIPPEILAEIPPEILEGRTRSTILDNPSTPPEVLAEVQDATQDRQSEESLVSDFPMAHYHQSIVKLEAVELSHRSPASVEHTLPRRPISERLRNITEEDIKDLERIIRNIDNNILLHLKIDLEKQGSMPFSLGQLKILEDFRANITNDPKEAGSNLVRLIEQQLLSRTPIKKVLKEFAEDLKKHIISTWPDITGDRALEKFSSHFSQLAFSSTTAFSLEKMRNIENQSNPALPDIKAEPTSIEDIIPLKTIQKLGQVIRRLDKHYLEELRDSLELKNLRRGEDVACINELQVLEDFRMDMNTEATNQTQQTEVQHNLALKKAVTNLLRLVSEEISGPLDAAKKAFKANLEQHLPPGVTVEKLRGYQIAIKAFPLPETTSTISNKDQFHPPILVPVKREKDRVSQHSDKVSRLSERSLNTSTGYTEGSDPRWQEVEKGIHIRRRVRQELKMAAFRFTKNEDVLGRLQDKINLSQFKDNIGSIEAIIVPARIKAKEQRDKALQKFYKVTSNSDLLKVIMEDTSNIQGKTIWLAKSVSVSRRQADKGKEKKM